MSINGNDWYAAERQQVKALKDYIEHCNKLTDIDSIEAREMWFNSQWTIGFNGMTITVTNCAALYNAICNYFDEELS